YPFGLIGLMIISNNKLISDLPLDLPVIVTEICAVAAAFVGAVLVTAAAERSRSEAVETLSSELSSARVANPNGARVEQLQYLINRIRDFREGAFRPLF